MDVNDMSYIGRISAAIGASEPSLRLLVSLIIGYPLAFLHRYTLHGKMPALQHLFFIICGIGIGYYNFGTDVLHSVACVVTLYLTMLIVGGTLASVIFSFIFQMGYLLIGYYYTETDTYDIKWSMPHCVLVLRLIGLTYDVYDGARSPDKLSAEQQLVAIKKLPSLLEIGGHAYFPGGFLVGPQFSMKRYQNFVHGTYIDKENRSHLPSCVIPGLLRGGMGIAYLLIYQLGSWYIAEDSILQPEYESLPFWQRALWLGLWGKIVLAKYISCWLIAEGVCIVTGLTHNGKDENGNDLWNGCANVKLRLYERTCTFGELIASFNINTNAWMAQYIYKRLKFLGNKNISQGVTLVFLAMWHGLHDGYYMCFFNEFVVMKFEKELEPMVYRNSKAVEFLNNSIVKYIKWILQRIYSFIFTGYCLVPFVLLTFSRWLQAYLSVYFCGHILFFGWPLYAPFVRKLLSPPRSKPTDVLEKKGD